MAIILGVLIAAGFGIPVISAVLHLAAPEPDVLQGASHEQEMASVSRAEQGGWNGCEGRESFSEEICKL